jgi:hypothetical protein
MPSFFNAFLGLKMCVHLAFPDSEYWICFKRVEGTTFLAEKLMPSLTSDLRPTIYDYIQPKNHCVASHARSLWPLSSDRFLWTLLIFNLGNFLYARQYAAARSAKVRSYKQCTFRAVDFSVYLLIHQYKSLRKHGLIGPLSRCPNCAFIKCHFCYWSYHVIHVIKRNFMSSFHVISCHCVNCPQTIKRASKAL